ncbi:Rep protein (plasmid) [Clostridium cadaveris]|uniref:rolling circle replication-associated protein n=1 Tax=Clostridium cadaveris TaxID=1529 RepID=UPI001E389E23|nr:Rep protein [Clostridium cadaveris]UFH66757.1 Rep protein [Clostridium cadaveris]
MGSYSKKVIISGDIVEVYKYDSSVLYGYSDTHKSSCGRRSIANDEDKEKNRETVLKRARRDLRRIINANMQPYSKFLTLTFKENIQDISECNYEFKKFIQRLNYNFKIKLKYSCVIEFQKRGAIHYHVVLYNLTQKIDVKLLQDLWGHGFIKINAIDNVDNVGAYVCKYMTKTNDDRLLGKKMYFNSRCLNKPIEIKEPDLVESVESSLLGQALTYESSFKNKYNSISYKQYIIK